MQIKYKNADKIQSENSEYDNNIKTIVVQELEIGKEMPKWLKMHALSNGDLVENMYQHVQFDEIPFDSDPLYDHRQIYSHDRSHIEYRLYEDIEATAAFYVHMQEDNENACTEHKNTAYTHNLGRPVSKGHNTSIQAI